MKKRLRLITLGISVTLATPVLSSYLDNDSELRAMKQEAQEWQEKVERTKKALKDNDDAILKEEIFNIDCISEGAGCKPEKLKKLMRQCEIPSAKVLKILSEMIRDGLPVLDENRDLWSGRPYIDVLFAVELLEAVRGPEATALIEKCLQSKNQHIRDRVANIIEWQTRTREVDLKGTNIVQTVTPKPIQPITTEIEKQPTITTNKIEFSGRTQTSQQAVAEIEEQDESKQSYTMVVALGALLALCSCAVFYFIRKKK